MVGATGTEGADGGVTAMLGALSGILTGCPPVPMDDSLPSAVWAAVGSLRSSSGVRNGLVGLPMTTGAGADFCRTGCFTGSGAGSSFWAHETKTEAKPTSNRVVVSFFIEQIQ